MSHRYAVIHSETERQRQRQRGAGRERQTDRQTDRKRIDRKKDIHTICGMSDSARIRQVGVCGAFIEH
jgi:hypothetical protein